MKDLIGLAGGFNVYQYAPSPIQWIDPLGLVKFTPKTKGTILEENEQFRRANKCEKCLCCVTKPSKSQCGVTPPNSDWQIDHIEAERVVVEQQK